MQETKHKCTAKQRGRHIVKSIVIQIPKQIIIKAHKFPKRKKMETPHKNGSRNRLTASRASLNHQTLKATDRSNCCCSGSWFSGSKKSMSE
jgi:hypothetical protein